jgi:peptidoglycan/LPS O-acetylase OafA/YrhL
MLLVEYLSGAVTFGYLIAGLFFLRFWRRTGDELFLAFALAFALFGMAQGAIMLADNYLEERSWAYLPRLAGFAIIIVAIWRKNRRRI